MFDEGKEERGFLIEVHTFVSFPLNKFLSLVLFFSACDFVGNRSLIFG